MEPHSDNDRMSRAPFVIAGSVVAASIGWTIHLASEPDPFAADAALTVALGLVVISVIDAAGLLLSRGRWSRWLGYAIAGGEGTLFVLTEGTATGVVAIAVTGVALVGLAGPWLDGWIRARQAAEGPGPRPLTVVFGLLALLPAVGVASPSGLSAWHGVLGGAAVLLVWSYSRALLWALWAVRLGLPFISIPAIVSSPWGGAVLLAAITFVTSAAAWARESLLAVNPLIDRLLGPRVGTAMVAPTDDE